MKVDGKEHEMFSTRSGMEWVTVTRGRSQLDRKRAWYGLVASLALITSVTVPVARGDDDTLAVGMRVRIRTVEPGPARIGALVTGSADELWVRLEGAQAPVALRRTDVAMVEVSRGVKRHTLRGLLAGALVWGVVVGGVAAFDTLDESGVGEPAFVGGLLAAGAGIGALVKTEHWQPVPTGSVSIPPAPRGRGPGLQFTVTF